MKNKIPSSARRLRRAVISAVALCAAASVYAQNSQSSTSSSGTDSSTNTRTGLDRTRTGTGASSTGTGTSSSGSSTSGQYGSDTSGTMSSGSASGSMGNTRSANMGNSDMGNLNRSDRRFVTKAVELNTEEIRLSELAAQQATNPAVRSFAQQLVTEHTQVSTELSAIASRKGLSAMARDDYDQRAVSKLGKKTGKDFDEAYIEKMVEAHEDAVDLFEKASRNAKDTELQTFAAKVLPTLRQHQQHAKSLEKSVD